MPISRWLIRHLSSVNVNSIGSSSVRMCLRYSALIQVEHRGDRGRFARAGDAGQQHHPLIVFAKLLDDRRQIELGEVGNAAVDAAGDHAHVSLLLHEIDAESPQFAIDIGGVREIDAAGFVEDFLPALIHKRQAEPHRSRRSRSARGSSAAATRAREHTGAGRLSGANRSLPASRARETTCRFPNPNALAAYGRSSESPDALAMLAIF